MRKTLLFAAIWAMDLAEMLAKGSAGALEKTSLSRSEVFPKENLGIFKDLWPLGSHARPRRSILPSGKNKKKAYLAEIEIRGL